MEALVARLMDETPFWVLFAVTVALCALSMGIGFVIGRLRHSTFVKESETPLRNIVAAELALQTLLLAFTFGGAAQHYNERDRANLEEARAVQALWTESLLLPAEVRPEVQSLLRGYLEARREELRRGEGGPNLPSREFGRKAAVLSVKMKRSHPDSDEVQAFVDTIQDYPAIRGRLAIGERIPPIVWFAVYLLSFLAMIPLGFHAGLTGSLRLLAAGPLVVTFSLVLVLIADLDSPKRGQLRANESAFEDVRRYMESTGPAPAGSPQKP